MEDFQLLPLEKGNTPEFKREMQKAFQCGYKAEYGPCREIILPERDIDQSLHAPDASAYAAWVNGRIEGGAVLKIGPAARHNHLELLFVRAGTQSRGLGHAIWKRIEQLYPETETWETFTPYFEKRNLHFYVNCCGFHIVEFFNPRHPLPEMDEDGRVGGMDREAGQYFFRFLKTMRSERRQEESALILKWSAAQCRKHRTELEKDAEAKK